MNKQLLIEADNLCQELKQKMWKAAATNDKEFYRLDRLYIKSKERYKRRYKELYH